MSFTSGSIDLGKATKGAAAEGGAKGLFYAAEHVKQVSQTRVPHQEGTLENSAVASVDEAELIAAVSYDTPYAVAQHENLENRHDEGRQAKYLEASLASERGKAAELIAREIRKALGTE